MTAQPIRFAVIGCGMMGQRHAETLRATEGAQVTWLQDRHVEQADKIAQPGERTTAEYGAVLAADNVDAVVLCLPSSLHAEFGQKAVAAGKHVVTEKPIDTEPARARELAAACKAAGLQLAVISQNRFADGPYALHAAYRAGMLGKAALVEASVKWLRHEPYYKGSDWRGTLQGEGGGVIMNQGIHTIDLLLWMFGTPEVVTGIKQVNRDYMETEDVGVAVLRFPGGEVATLAVTTSAYPGFQERISVYGMTGTATVEAGKMTDWRVEGEVPHPAAPAFAPPSEGLNGKLVLFQRQFRNIIAAIRGEEPLLVTAEESIAVLETALAIYD